MPVYSDYLYGGLSPLSYSSLLLSGRSSGSSGYSSGYSSGNYYGGSGARSRYSPLLPTISESGLSPIIGRRSPRSAVSYTKTALYSPRTTPAYHVPRPVNINTENIDVSTPRKQISRPQVQETEASTSSSSSVPRSTIKRGRTVVRIHTKHAVKEEQNEDKRRLKMTPGERLKEKYLLRESEWDKKKREEEELIRLKEIERDEAEKRFKRLMLLEEPLPLPDVLPIEIAEFSPQPELIPVQPEVRTITEDLDTTPKNSSDDDTTDTESSASSTSSVRKKKRKKDSTRNSEVSIPEDDEIPISSPRTRQKSNQMETDFADTKRNTIKRNLSNEKLNSVKGGVSKKKTTKKSKKIETKIKPVITSISFDSENNEPKSPKLYIENIVVEEEQIIMIKAPPKCRNKKKQMVANKQKSKLTIEKVSTAKVQDKVAVSTEIVPETLTVDPVVASSQNEDSCKQKVDNNLPDSSTSCETETPSVTAQNVSENTSKVDVIPLEATPTEPADNNLKLLDWELPPKKWDRRESKMDWDWPDDTQESKPTPKEKVAKNKQISKEISTSNKNAFECKKLNNTEKIIETVKVPETTKMDEKDTDLKSPKLKTPTDKNTQPKSPNKNVPKVQKAVTAVKIESVQENVEEITANSESKINDSENKPEKITITVDECPTQKSEIIEKVETKTSDETKINITETKTSTVDLSPKAKPIAKLLNSEKKSQNKPDIKISENIAKPGNEQSPKREEKFKESQEFEIEKPTGIQLSPPPKKWDRRESRMDWDWPEDDDDEPLQKQGTVKRRVKGGKKASETVNKKETNKLETSLESPKPQNIKDNLQQSPQEKINIEKVPDKILPKSDMGPSKVEVKSEDKSPKTPASPKIKLSEVKNVDVSPKNKSLPVQTLNENDMSPSKVQNQFDDKLPKIPASTKIKLSEVKNVDVSPKNKSTSISTLNESDMGESKAQIKSEEDKLPKIPASPRNKLSESENTDMSPKNKITPMSTSNESDNGTSKVGINSEDKSPKLPASPKIKLSESKSTDTSPKNKNVQNIQSPNQLKNKSVPEISVTTECSAPETKPVTVESQNLEEPIKWNRRESRMDWIWPEDEDVKPTKPKLPPKKANVPETNPTVIPAPKAKPKIKKVPAPLKLTETPLEDSPKQSPAIKIESPKIETKNVTTSNLTQDDEIKISDFDIRLSEKDDWLYSETYENDGSFSPLLPKREKSVEERISKITSWLHPDKSDATKSTETTEIESVTKQETQKTKVSTRADKIPKNNTDVKQEKKLIVKDQIEEKKSKPRDRDDKRNVGKGASKIDENKMDSQSIPTDDAKTAVDLQTNKQIKIGDKIAALIDKTKHVAGQDKVNKITAKDDEKIEQAGEKNKSTELDDKLSKINAFLSPKPAENTTKKTKDTKTNVDNKMNKTPEVSSTIESDTEKEKNTQSTDLDEKMKKINAFLSPKPVESVGEKTQDLKTTELDAKLSKINAFLAPKAKATGDSKNAELDDKLSKINAFLSPKANEPEEIKEEKTTTPQTTKNTSEKENKKPSELDEKLSKINAFLSPKPVETVGSSTEKTGEVKSSDKKNKDLDDKLSRINAFLSPKPKEEVKAVTDKNISVKPIEKTKTSALDEKLSKINAILNTKQPVKLPDPKEKLQEAKDKKDTKTSELDEKLSKINAFLSPKPAEKTEEKIDAAGKESKLSELDEKLSKINAFLAPKSATKEPEKCKEEAKATETSELDEKLSKINAFLAPKIADKEKDVTEKKVDTDLDDKLSKINAWLSPTKIEDQKIPEKPTDTKTKELDDKLSKINAFLTPAKTEDKKSESKADKNTTLEKKVGKTSKATQEASDKTLKPKDVVDVKVTKPVTDTKAKNTLEPRQKKADETVNVKLKAKGNKKDNVKSTETCIQPKDEEKTEISCEKTDKSENSEVSSQSENELDLDRDDELRSTIKARGTVKENKKLKQQENIPKSPESKLGGGKKKSPSESKNKTKPESPTDKSPESKIEEKKTSVKEAEKTETEKKSAKKLKSEKVAKKKSAVKKTEEKTEESKPKIKFPAPNKPLFITPAMNKLLKNRDEPVIKPLRRFKEPKPVATEPVAAVVAPPAEHQVKITADRVSTMRHMVLKQPSVEDDDDETSSSSSEDEESSSGSDTETESKPDRTSTSSEDSGIGSTHTSPLTNKNECSVNCHRKCEKHMPNLCGVNQKLLAEALCSVKKGRTNPGSTKKSTAAGAEGREGASPGSHPARRLSTSLSSDSESGEEGGGSRRYTPPARTIPRFRKYTVDDYQFLKVLGKGSFGKVLLAELRGTDCYYAVKCLKKDVVLEDDDVECTLIERKVLALGTRHPYLCHLFCTFQTESHLFFVMEYLNGGDLMFHIQQSGRFDQARACFYAAEIVSGLKFLHKKGIVYRDLKLDNILLDYEGHVRIADFGMCKLQIYLDRTADTFCGTPDYMAPEIIKGLHYNQCVDWWSFGVLLYEMLIGQSPFNGCDEDELFWSICNEQPYYPRFLSKESQSILALLLDKDSSRRLGTPDCPAGDVYLQPFFKSIDWPALDRKELEPPFKPRVLHALDVQYFDTAFTQEAARLTPVDKEILQSMDQSQFHGFSYTNPNACNE